MLTRIFGLHGTGKTTVLLERLEACVREKKQAFLVVPEQAAVSAERLLIDRLGNPANMYIEVINFKRLCNRVFRESGGLADRIPDAAAGALAMSHVLEQNAGLLKEYARLATDTDFAARMLATVEEMHRSRVSPEMLEELCEALTRRGDTSLSGKLSDVALAYRAYDAYMLGTLDFPGDLLDKLYETLCGFAFFAGKRVFFDSFYGFTAQESALIDKIIASADETCITFLCDSERQSDPCFVRGTSAARVCRQSAEKHGVPVKDIFLSENRKFAPDSALAHIAQSFSLSALSLEPPEKPYDGVSLYACEDIYAEARCAAALISDLLLKGVSPRSIAVCARSVEDYAGILDDAFEKAGLPYSFDRPIDLAATPAAALVTNAFEVCFSWSTEAVSAYLKTGLTGLSDGDADRLDLYIRTWSIRGKAYFHEEWAMDPLGLRDAPPDLAALERISTARDALLAPLDGFAELLEKAVTAADFAEAVYTLIEDITRLSGAEHFDDHADGLYLDLLYRALDCLNDTLGAQSMTPRRFYELYRAAIAHMRVGKIPERLDSIRFSPLALMRTDGVRYVFLLGVNDGIFPAAVEQTDVFRSRERRLLAELGVELDALDEDKTYDELFLAYTALCSASEHAYVLYRRTSPEGKELYPSLIVRLLEAMTGGGPTDFSALEPTLAPISNECLFERFLTLPESVEKATIRAYFEEDPYYAARLHAIRRGDDAVQPLSDETLSALYGASLQSSYSRLESYRRCPFSYFCTYTLRLSPPARGEIGAAEHGNIVHKALEELAPVLCERMKGGVVPSDEELSALVKSKLTELWERLAVGHALDGRNAYMFSKLERSLLPLCKLLSEELTVSRFVPMDFELAIGTDGAVSPAVLPLADGGELRIVGKIDRVDVYRDEHSGKSWIRITDYKTGSTKFDLQDVERGFNLQMLLYLYTLLKNGSERYGNVYPAGVVYNRVVAPSEKGALTDEKDEEQPEFTSDTSGITVRDFDVVFAMDATGSGRYVPVKLKAGALPEDAPNTLAEDELIALLERTARLAASFADGIRRGNKCAEPEAAKGHDACEYCDFRTICPGGNVPLQFSRA